MMVLCRCHDDNCIPVEIKGYITFPFYCSTGELSELHNNEIPLRNAHLRLD